MNVLQCNFDSSVFHNFSMARHQVMLRLNSVTSLTGATAPFIATTNRPTDRTAQGDCARVPRRLGTDRPLVLKKILVIKILRTGQAAPLLLCQHVNLGPRYHFCPASPSCRPFLPTKYTFIEGHCTGWQTRQDSWCL